MRERTMSVRDVASDFDLIAAALAAAPPRETLSPAERSLLRHIPSGARTAIDVGCGDGLLTRAIACRGLSVLGVDVSAGMIELARARSREAVGVEYRLADIMAAGGPLGTFDVVLSVAMAHHVPLRDVVPALVRLVAPGGVLLVQDIMDRRGAHQLPVNILAMGVRQARQLIAPSRITSHVTSAYHKHGAHEEYLDASMVAPTFAALLPAARVIRHLEWRYSVVWHAPAAA
jgi:2-polyprenyl-3-methyl-5-hydroxy-6-metoxy-1,4-benzoquinol methylase